MRCADVVTVGVTPTGSATLVRWTLICVLEKQFYAYSVLPKLMSLDK